MGDFARATITFTDQTMTTSGVSTEIPFYLFATAENKYTDDASGTIAAGTTKEMAGKLLTMTSQRDVINTYGIANFITENGTVKQGDERNEVGLLALYQGLGVTDLAYAMRADIDLAQLEPSMTAPVGEPDNTKLWLDTSNSSFGMAVANGGMIASRAWTDVSEFVMLDGSLVTETEEGYAVNYPVSAPGLYAIAIKDGQVMYFESFADASWKLIGSAAWRAEKGAAQVFFNSSINYPDGSVAGSVWFKTTTANNGLYLVVKKYANTRWNVIAMPVASSFMDIEKAIGVNNLSSSSMGLTYDGEMGKFDVCKFDGSKTVKITATATEANIPAGTMKVTRLGADNTFKQVAFTTEAMAREAFATLFTQKMLEGGMNGLSMTIDSEKAVILSDMGTTVKLEMTNALSAALGINMGEYNHWSVVNNLVASEFEPRKAPEEGTLWFNDDYIVDIMVSNGSKWTGYKNMYPNASIYVQSAEPEGVTDQSLWIDPSASEYPMLKRYFDGEWETVDLSDQTSPLGCVFAELRANSGYSYTGSSHEPFSTDLEALMISDYVDPDAPDPRSYPAGMVCFNTRCSTNLVKEYKDLFAKAVEEIGETYQVGESLEFATPGTANNLPTVRWVCASGNNEDGSGIFGTKAQRKMVVRALAAAISGSEELRNENYDIFYVNVAGYPELDDEVASLNADRKETLYNVSDTPKALKPNATDIQNWANNAGNAVSHGLEGRVVRSAYQTRFYPPMGMTSNVDGLEVAVPASIAKMRTLMSLPRGQIAAGYNYGTITSLASVGYITDEGEYSPVQIGSNGLGPVITSLDMNPILARRNTGLMFWGENTEQSFESVLSDEHCVLTLIRLKRKLDEACNPFFYRINNQSCRDDFKRALENVLNTFVATGEIYDYVVNTDASVNTNERIQRKELWADVAISFAIGISYIYIPIRGVTYGSL